MGLRNSETFKSEFISSIIFWGCEYASDGETYYQDTLLPFNIGDALTKDDTQYKIIEKDWDYDNQKIYFIAKKIPKK